MPRTDGSVVTFDGDETLWDFRSAARAAVRAAADEFAAHGFHHPDGSPVTGQWLAMVREEVAARPPWRNATMEHIRRESFGKAAAVVGAGPHVVDRVYERFMHIRHSAVTLYPDTLSCLRDLAGAGVRMALVTNGNSRPTDLGLAEYFTVMVTAAECGHHKPDPVIYRYTAERLGVTPQRCIHVGDHLDEDVRAATRAGMRAVWLNRAQAPQPSDDRDAWATVFGLDGVPPLVLSQADDPIPETAKEPEPVRWSDVVGQAVPGHLRLRRA